MWPTCHEYYSYIPIFISTTCSSLHIIIFSVPGAVSNLLAEPRFTSVVVTWSPPENPNGAIIAYKVTYRVNNRVLNAVNTTGISTTFATPELPPGTNVSSISVCAYTSVGPGEAAMHPSVVTSQKPVPRE